MELSSILTTQMPTELYCCMVRMELSFILTLLADANRTRMTNTYCVYTVLRYS